MCGEVVVLCWIDRVCYYNVVSLYDFAIWSGKILQLLCILSFGMLCLSAISIMFVKIMHGIGNYVWSERKRTPCLP